MRKFASGVGGGSRFARDYELRSRLLARADRFVFMNHGYASRREGGRPWVRPGDRDDYFHMNLVRETLRGAPVDGRSVLDVGCGRGGACSYLVRYHRPALVRGLDFSASSIAFCRRRHRSPRLRFLRGDAHALPFDRCSFHVVTNVESSHCYPALERFFAEVSRVLKPRGFFCYADLMPPGHVAGVSRLLRRAGFRVRRSRDVTANVRLALERNATNLRRTFRSIADSLGSRAAKRHLRELHRGIHEVVLDQYRRGVLVYRIWLLQKP